MAKKYNVLSLCDGISTGQVALKMAGIRKGYYLASEINKFAIQATQANYPGTFQIGNVYDVNVDKIPMNIDLVFMGFPCQGFSFAGKQLNFNDKRSQLFFKGCKILKQCREYNPDVKFLFENVRMRAESEKVITTMLGVEPIRIDSALVCGQTRKRLYWTNIEGVEQPEDRGVCLYDILEAYVDDKYNLSAKVLARINTDDVRKKLYKLKLEREKSRAIISSVGRTTHREYFEKNQGQLVQVNPSKDSHGQQPYMQHRIYDAAYKAPALSQRSDSINIAAHSSFGVDNAKGTMRSLDNKSLNIDANYYKGLDNHAQRTHIATLSPAGTSQAERVYDVHGKSPTLGVRSGGMGAGTGLYAIEKDDVVVHNLQPRQGKGQGGKGHIMRYPGNKPYCLDTACGQAVELNDLIIRRLTPTECHRLQGMPDGYLSMLSDTQQYAALGNGWQADTIAHILSYLPK